MPSNLVYKKGVSMCKKHNNPLFMYLGYRGYAYSPFKVLSKYTFYKLNQEENEMTVVVNKQERNLLVGGRKMIYWRIYKVAKDLNISSKELIKELAEIGINKGHHFCTIEFKAVLEVKASIWNKCEAKREAERKISFDPEKELKELLERKDRLEAEMMVSSEPWMEDDQLHPIYSAIELIENGVYPSENRVWNNLNLEEWEKPETFKKWAEEDKQ